MVESAQSPPLSSSSVLLGEFLDALKRNGFSVGLGHYARVMTLLDRMGPACQPGQLRTMLCPLFATSAEQQERFYRVFDGWFPLFAERFEIAVEPEELAEVTAGARTAPSRWSWRVWIPIAATIMLAVGGLMVMRSRGNDRLPRADSAAPALPDVPRTQPSPQPSVPVEAIPAPRTWRDIAAEPWVQGLAVGVILLGFGIGEWRSYRRRRVVLERQRRERPPLVWPIRVEANANPLAESAEFYTTARRLRDRQTGERSRLDIPATIDATVSAVGFPTFRYVLETRPPEYLVLIEQASIRDHQARLYRQLVESLSTEGVHAAVYYYRDDPRVCEPAGGGNAAMISELRRRYPAHRLLVLGDGDGLIDPISGRRRAWVGEALGWPERALLTPEPVQTWGPREIALASHLVVLPASLDGLQAAIDHFQAPVKGVIPRTPSEARGTRDPRAAIPALSGADHVTLLRRRLGERGLQWVCACAVYPELQWNLTLYLGMLPEIGGGTIDDALLLELVRLPWFRAGSIPDEARSELLRVIRPDVERAARGVLITLLERNPAPAETIASSRYELDLVVQKLALHGKDRARRRELLRAAQRIPRDRVLSELSVLRLTDLDPGSTLALRLPTRLRRVFFQGGLPMFGVTTAARSFVAMLFVAGVLLAGRRPSVSNVAEQLQSAAQGDTGSKPVVQTGDPAEPPPAIVAMTRATSAKAKAITDSVYAALGDLSIAVRARDLAGIKRQVRQLDRTLELQLRMLFEQPLQHELRFTPQNNTVYGREGDSVRVAAYWDTGLHGGPPTRLVITVTRSSDGQWAAQRLSEVPPIPVIVRAAAMYPLVGDTTRVLLVIRSLSGQALSGLSRSVAVTSRDSSTARVLADGRIVAVRPGMTYLVAEVLSSFYIGIDSAKIIVRSQPSAADRARAEASRERTTSATLDSAIALYEAFNVEAARPILQRLVRDPSLSSNDRAIAFKHLGAAYAVLASNDSAVTYFIEALKLDPFIDLDPSKFAVSELAAFAGAKQFHFAVGILPVQDVNPDSGARFFVVTTQRAQLNVELINQEDTTRREVLYRALSVGRREYLWRAILSDGSSAARSDRPVAYEVRVTANATAAPLDGRPATATARQVFRVLPRASGAPSLATAFLTIGTRPLSTIIVNGRAAPTNPVANWQVPAGRVEIRFQVTDSTGAWTMDTVITVARGELRNLGRISLTRPIPGPIDDLLQRAEQALAAGQALRADSLARQVIALGVNIPQAQRRRALNLVTSAAASRATDDSAAVARSAARLRDAITKTRNQMNGTWQRAEGQVIGGVRVEWPQASGWSTTMTNNRVTGRVMNIGGICGANLVCRSQRSDGVAIRNLLSVIIEGDINFEWSSPRGARSEGGTAFRLTFVRDRDDWRLQRVQFGPF